MTPGEERFAVIPETVLYDRQLSALDVRVYGVIVRHADDETGEAWPGLRRIARLACSSKSAVHRSVQALHEAGHITYVRRGRTLPSLYRVVSHQRDTLPSDSRQWDSEVSPAGHVVSHQRDITKAIERKPLNEKTHSHVVAQDTLPAVSGNGHSPAITDKGFAEFYAAYPRKVGKRAAEKAWGQALKRTDPDTITTAARRLAADPNLPEPRYVPHPSTWLNRDGWDDDPLPDRTNGTKAHRTRDRIVAAAGRRTNGTEVLDVESWEVGT